MHSRLFSENEKKQQDEKGRSEKMVKFLRSRKERRVKNKVGV